MLFLDLIRSARPITVIVQNGRYDAFVEHPITKNDEITFEMLEKLGGINESVEDGRYHFSWKITLRGKIRMDLHPID